MAGQAISITQGPTTRVGTSSGLDWQPGREALDLTGLNGLRLDITVRGLYLSGSGSPTATVTIQTSMTNDDNPANWKSLGTSFTAITASNTSEVKSFDSGLLRYVRWSLELTGTSPSFTFEVLGMAW